jgi:beta-glucanase (GH16 family)
MKQYELVFAEHFEQDGRPDLNMWTHEVGEKWANREIQCYVNDDEHSYIKDAKLHLVATYHEDEPCPIRSARIHTFGKKHFFRGRFVFRAKMPKGRGSWPAIWFLGINRKEGWPICGEIDLVEYAGNRMHQVSCAIHTESYNHKIKTHKNKRTELATASDAFHEYMLDWTKDALVFYVDNKEVMRIDRKETDTIREWPFDQPFYMILNLAVGGWHGGPVAHEDFPFHFEIDYIRVYQETDD